MSKRISPRRRRIRGFFLLAVALAGLSAVRSLPDAQSATGDGRDGKFVPESGLYFGLWNRRGDMTQANIKANITARETQLGRNLDIDHHFADFEDSLAGWKTQWDIQNGRIPLIAWSTVDTLEVNAGQWDTHIRNNARGLKDLNSPVFLRWFWEPEWTQRTALTNGYTQYQNAWRRIYNIFQQEGATNVAFVYCATAWGFVSGEAQAFYPGDAYVDWVCSDGYNWAPAKPGSKWASFDKIFRPTHDFAVAHNKPMMGAEIGVMEGDPGAKAAWLNDARNVIKTSYPNMAAFVYFDEDRQQFGGYDWRLDSSSAALNSWVAMGRDPYFSPSDEPNTSTTQPPTTAAPTTAAPTTAPPTTTTTTPPPAGTMFADGFESGNLDAWTKVSKASVSTTQKVVGTRGGVITTTAGAAYLARDLGVSDSTLTVDLRIKAIDVPNIGVPAVRFLGGGNGLAAVLISSSGEIVARDPRTGTMFRSGASVTQGAWHRLVVTTDTRTGILKVQLDGATVLDLSTSTFAGPAVSRIELGDLGGRTPAKAYSFAYDEIAVR